MRERNAAAPYIGGWFHTYTEPGQHSTEALIESADDCIDQMREDHGLVVIDPSDDATVKLVRRATFDPGAFVKRELHTDGDPDELHVWQAKAVLAALAKGDD